MGAVGSLTDLGEARKPQGSSSAGLELSPLSPMKILNYWETRAAA